VKTGLEIFSKGARRCAIDDELRGRLSHGRRIHLQGSKMMHPAKPVIGWSQSLEQSMFGVRCELRCCSDRSGKRRWRETVERTVRVTVTDWLPWQAPASDIPSPWRLTNQQRTARYPARRSMDHLLQPHWWRWAI